MKNFKGVSILAAAAVFCLALVASPAISGADAHKDIVDTAVAAGQFNTLAKALQAAGLVETLKGAGPFTVQLLLPDLALHRAEIVFQPRRFSSLEVKISRSKQGFLCETH